ncbi:MAG: LON peptidase substrate-binding domain-containing protein [Flavobacteriales bacterium]|nr:LON peptidase substrate-binding domain-containing protein [Flavobacteriales bacterium]
MDQDELHIPCFPLSIMLLPGEQTYLHLFEPRYKQLLHDVLSGDRTFVIPFVDEGQMSTLGTKVKVQKVLKTYPGGESDILIEAVEVVRLLSIETQLDDRLYPGGVARSVSLQVSEPIEAELLERFKEFELERGNTRRGYDYLPTVDLYSIARGLNLSSEDKYRLIKMSFNQKQRFLIKQIEYLSLLHEQEDGVFKNFYLN